MIIPVLKHLFYQVITNIDKIRASENLYHVCHNRIINTIINSAWLDKKQTSCVMITLFMNAFKNLDGLSCQNKKIKTKVDL